MAAWRVAKFLREKGKTCPTSDKPVIDILGHIQPNFDNLPHLLIDFLVKSCHIRLIRHIPNKGVHPSTALLPWRQRHGTLVLVNDWLAPPRTLDLTRLAKTNPNIIYHLYGCENASRPQFVNTIISGANRVIYDFCKTWEHAAVVDRSTATLPTLTDDLAPIHHFVRHVARYIADGAGSIVIAGSPSCPWFDSAQQPTIPNSIPVGLRRFIQLLLLECGRNGINSPLEKLTFVNINSPKVGKYLTPEYLAGIPYDRDRPMLVTIGNGL